VFYTAKLREFGMADHAQAFRLHRQRAATYFETGQKYIGSDSDAAIAAFDSMLFECARARRIARDSSANIENLGLDSKEFLGIMDDVAAVRNVMEHWADVINPRTQKNHNHVSKGGLKISVDESSIIILGPEEIYKGPLNLYDVYRYIMLKLKKMRIS
jgi:hypothetical protein